MSYLDGSLGASGYLIRAIQGHSSNINRQINPDEAHTRVTGLDQLPMLLHYTKTQNLFPILGPWPQAFCQGGGRVIRTVSMTGVA